MAGRPFNPMTNQNNSSSQKKTTILFVCLGNICRSPTGEAILKKLVAEQGLTDFFHIESAGTGNYHIGESPDPRTRHHGEKRGLKFESLAQQFNPEQHFDFFDYILCMDQSNLQNLRQKDLSQKYHSKILSMMSFAPDSSHTIVPDPYTGGPQDFELVIDLLEVACQNFLQKVRTFLDL